jgi:hypothetical protein
MIQESTHHVSLIPIFTWQVMVVVINEPFHWPVLAGSDLVILSLQQLNTLKLEQTIHKLRLLLDRFPVPHKPLDHFIVPLVFRNLSYSLVEVKCVFEVFLLVVVLEVFGNVEVSSLRLA